MNTDPSHREISFDGQPLATLLGNEDVPAPTAEVTGELVISRFAWIRSTGGQLVAETSLGPRAVVLQDPRAVAVLGAFATPRTLDEGLAAAAGLTLAAATELVELMHQAAILRDPAGASAEESAPLAVWEFHDLLFHARSRPGRSQARHGSTYRFLDRLPPTPGLPPARWTEGVALPRPDFDQLEREDPPLSLVQERRRSIRRFAAAPLALNQLSEFLFRVGRADDYWELPIPGRAAASNSFVSKPYPSGGGAYELEMYAAVQNCRDLDPGLHHYVAAEHRLALVRRPCSELDQVFVNAAAAMGCSAASLQVVIVITARFGRLAWKYESLAYELVLKHVGVVMELMYLAATAMDLAPCAIGAGNSDLFARLSGVDYYEEPAVGEFALGSRLGNS